ncbi:GHKL domain-containing protein [Eubacterium ruminantium]|nr:GHKL domain-containing protein [Eubacterium ruminantium]
MSVFSSDLIQLYITTGISYLAFAFTLLNVVLILACVLGRRRVVLNKSAFVVLLIGFVLDIALQIGAVYLIIKQYETPFMNQRQMEIFTKCLNYSGLVFTGIITLAFSLVIYKKNKILRTIETFIYAFFIIQYSELIILYVYAYLFNLDIESCSSELSSGMGNASFVCHAINLTISLILFMMLYFGLYKKGRFYKVEMKYVFMFIAWEILLYFVPGISTFEMFDGDDGKVRGMGIIIAICLVLLGLVIPLFIFTMITRKYGSNKNERQEKYLEAQLEYIRQYKVSQTETRAFRHDIINNLTFMNMLMKEGKIKEANDHLEHLLGEVRALSPKYITGDEMLDCIVSMKLSDMEQLGIKYSSDGVVDGGLNMKPMDICNLFANAFDNAVEACARLPKSAPKWIDFNIRRTENFCILKLSNSSINEADTSILFNDDNHYTSKDDEKYHGFGTKSMKNSLAKYDGMLKASTEKGSFILTIMIPRKM